ncbi:phosphatidylglycerol lysyltransferase domain-containing protein [Microbacterium sp. 10M-3C3]|uniref:bifunctional lysylphosphatidylglycerol flippase/synthetase MprF n=1 Tax=Microbacterium sp. 10M-3C3 TaxID=2483401 RepID=UPI000F630FA7|nr:phosphatidylglycerol lysyltransferase domain-containing protein [Microbacterium sp. 10M-3C3]
MPSTDAPVRAPLVRGRIVAAWLRSHPVAVGFAVLVVVAATATGTLWGTDSSPYGAGPLTTFAGGRWTSLVTALVVAGSPVHAAFAFVLSLTVLAYAERLLGSVRALVLLPVLGVAGVLVGVALHAAAWTVTDLQPVVAAEVPVVDPVIPIVGVVMAASAFAPALWRRRLRVGGFGVLALFALYGGDADDWYRIATAILGLAVGAVLVRRTGHHGGWHRSSVRESRALVALLVAVSALGPLVGLVTGGGRGPFSVVVDTYAQYDDVLVARCAAAANLPGCDAQLSLLLTRGVGPALLAATPLVLLIVAALGLRQGRRAAWMLAVGVQSALAVLAVVAWWFEPDIVSAWDDGSGAEYVLWVTASIGIPVALVVALVLSRRLFGIRATRRAAGTATGVVVAAFVVCATTFALVEAAGSHEFDAAPTRTELVLLTLRRFIPRVFLEPAGHTPFPHRGLALFAYQWVGVLFWAVVVAAMLWVYRHPRLPRGEDGRLYRDLLRRGGDTLGFLGTWDGNRYWYPADRAAGIAYRVVGDVALALADPLAPLEDRAEVVEEFAEFCGRHGWTPVLYSVHEETMDALRPRGWQALPVGVETVLDLRGLEFTGKAWQKVRQPLTRAEREGYTAVWSRWNDLTLAQTTQIVAIDEEWVADRALPEMGFTLGSLDELRDADVRLLLAVGPDDRIEAVTSWMPTWTHGRVTGWTLDFMRRRIGGPNGMMEFLIAKAALALRDEGAEILSLSGAPLADDPDEADAEPSALRAFLRWLADALEPAYGFASLFRFKGKFRPRYRPLFMAYRDALQLPAIGAAVGRAYLPDASRADLVALARTAWGGRR